MTLYLGQPKQALELLDGTLKSAPALNLFLVLLRRLKPEG